MLTHKVIPINANDTSQIGNARRQAAAMAGALDFDETRVGELSIIVTEAARNIATHAESGELILSPWSLNGAAGFDVFALDCGKGIPNLERAMEDGYSTSGTAGQGLGAISRMAGEFQIYSTASQGTALFARVFRDSTMPPGMPVGRSGSFGVVSVPVTGEIVNGDAWSFVHTPERTIYIIADGLGHGRLASEAGEEAIRVFHEAAKQSPEQILREIHGALAKTRGAAVSVAEILRGQRILNYAGVGNVSGAIWSKGKSRSMISMNGTVGHTVAKIQSFSYPCEPDSLLIMHSDGLGTRWGMERYPGLVQCHPAVTAGVLYRDFSRKRDDATILVSRI